MLPKMFGPEIMQAFHEFKAIFDPDGKMNPGKLIDPYDPTENLRLGTNYDPPAVREAPKDSLIITDGFSCLEQIAQTADRHGLHLAQGIQMALLQGPEGPAGDYPERQYPKVLKQRPSPAMLALGGAGIVFGGFLLWSFLKRATVHASEK
jgi:hypothetical protein